MHDSVKTTIQPMVSLTTPDHKRQTKRKILLLGATGSIGQQTIDVLHQHEQDFELVGISAGHDLEGLKQIIKQFNTIQFVGCSNQEDGTLEGIPLFGGQDQMVRLVERCDYDVLVNAVVGFRGLEPTLRAIQTNHDVALANKESLVCGGELVKEALASSTSQIYPIDSEHSAIYQCLQGNRIEQVRHLYITASGGSLRDLSREQLADITPARALKHPSWNMGARITIDSSTMVNKGFEVIEAHYLFDLPYAKIIPILHPQSIIHSMVEYEDHAIIAQMGSADMRLPIQYALYSPERPVLNEDHPLDFSKMFSLDFKAMDYDRFKMLNVCIEAGKKKGNAGCILNGADEQAVELFLKEKISFLEIEEAILYALEHVEWIEHPTFEQLRQTDLLARQAVLDFAHLHHADK